MLPILLYAVAGFAVGLAVAPSVGRCEEPRVLAGDVVAVQVSPFVCAGLTAATFAATGVSRWPLGMRLALIAWGTCSAWILVTDLAGARVPNAAVLVTGLAGLLPVAGAALREGSATVLLTPLAGAAVVLVLGAVAASTTSHLGLGDAKLAGALTPLVAFAGSAATSRALLACSCLTLVTAVTALARGASRTARVPIGPALAYGALLGCGLA